MEEILTFNEFAKYLKIGNTKAHEVIKEHANDFAFKIGNRWYVRKDLLDKWVINQIHNN